MRTRAICIGSTSKDIFFPTSEGKIFETPEDVTSQVKVAFELGGKFLAPDRYEALGGVAANVATGLARLGVDSFCYSKVGRDEVGHWVEAELMRHEVGTTTLDQDPNVKSDVSAIIVISQTGDRLIFHNRDANEKLEITEEHLPEADWLFVSALNGHWQANLEKIFDIKRKRGSKLAINPGQHNLKEAPQVFWELMPEIDVLVLNKDEAIELLLGSGVERDASKLNSERVLLESLHRAGVPLIGMTDGKRGAWGYDGEHLLHAEIYERRGVVDTTGAGDAFSSGFLAAHFLNLSLEKALQFGIANGGSVVGYFGAIDGLLNQEDIRHLISHVRVTALPTIRG